MPTVTTFPIPRGLLELIRSYKPFQIAKRIPLEATVEDYHTQILPQHYTKRPHLVLQLAHESGSDYRISKYPQYYSQLELSLDFYLVRDMHNLLKQGKIAKFSRDLIVYKDWFLRTLGRLVNRKLVGTISVDGKSYYVEFKRSSAESNPKLKYIRSIPYQPPKSF